MSQRIDPRLSGFIWIVVVALLLVGYFFSAVAFGNRLMARTAAFIRWRFEWLFDRVEAFSELDTPVDDQTVVAVLRKKD